MRVVIEIMPVTALFSMKFMILYGASQRGLPDAVSVSCISQLITTSVSRKSRCVSKGYPLTLPYIVFLKSFMNSVEDFSGGIIPSYLPRSSSETFFEGSEGTDNDLIELTASFNVVDILNTSSEVSLTKRREGVNYRI